MAPIPQPTATTVRAILAAYEDANENWDSLGISVGEIGTECDRALWYSFRWASRPEVLIGRKLSIFRTGDMWEDRLVADLESIGVEVYDQQDRVRLVSGHVRGKIDGKALGIPEAPKTEHLCEFKSSNDKGFKEIMKLGCKVGKPLHYAQIQIGMHYEGLQRALYYVVNKNDDDRYAERIHYDAAYCIRELARCERIINTSEPPSRICENTKMPPCLFCRHKAVCHEGAWPRVTCRSCMHSTPEMGGDASWSCARWAKPLGIDEQKAGCPAHLHLPGFVPGEMIDSDAEAETVTYKLRDGSTWIDGLPANDNNEAAEEAA